MLTFWRSVDESRHECAVHGTCGVRPHAHTVNDAVRGALAGVSLATLAASFPGEGRGPVADQQLDERSAPSQDPSQLDPGLRRGTGVPA